MNLLVEARQNPYKFYKKYTFHEIAAKFHPDHNSVHPEIFSEFKTLYESSLKPPIIIDEYALVQHIARGDLCDIYRCATGQIIKIPYVISKAANKLLGKECTVLLDFYDHAKDTSYRYYFPQVEKTFVLDKKRINVFAPYAQGPLYSLLDIKKKYPKGIETRHVVWMFRRLLVAIGYINKLEWGHCAITPEHCLFDVENHGLYLVDWIHAEQLGKKIQLVPKNRKEWYGKNKVSNIELDIMLAANCMFSIANINLHRKVKAFLQGCLLSGIQDAWQLHEEFGELLFDLYGNPHFVNLTMEN